MTKSNRENLKIKRWVSSHFNEKAFAYDFERTAVGYRLRHNLIKKLILESFKPNAVALDLGCGTGEYTTLLAQMSCEVIAGDLSKKMLLLAKSKVEKHKLGKNVQLIRLELTKLPFRNELFDIVTCIAVLDWVPNYCKLLREARKVLKHGGKFIACVDSLWSPYRLYRLTQRRISHEHGYSHYFSSRELCRALVTCGFVVEKLLGDVLLAQVATRLLFEPKGIAISSKVLKVTQPLDRYLLSLPFIKPLSAHYLVVSAKHG